MKKFWQLGLSAVCIVSVWWVAVTLFAYYRVAKYGVTPTFPYYNSLLIKTDAVHAVWGHFDGVHYLKLAEVGYVDIGTQAFFPVYPLLIHGVHITTGLPYITAGRVVSYVSLVFAFLCLFYLFQNNAWRIMIPLLVFPTSFFLAGIYTESLFLFETLLFFLLLRKKYFFAAALVAGIASGTRIVGSMLMLSLAIELWQSFKKAPTSKRPTQLITYTCYLILSISGLLAYVYFLWQRFGDPIMFIHVQSMFGSGRTNGQMIFLPQVAYRYLRIFMTVRPVSFVLVRAVFEFVVFSLFGYVLCRVWRRIPLSWSVYCLMSLLLPALSGTLSSIPRYSLVIFPLLISTIRFKSWPLRFIYYGFSLSLCLYLFSLFARGLFVA